MAAMAGSLDANVLLRLLLNDVPDQHQAVVRLLESGSGQFAVADIAVTEVAFVLTRNYALTRAQVAEAIDGLMSLVEINCNRGLFEKALKLYVKSPKLSFEDCCLVVYAELNDAAPLWTFDRKLASQATHARLVDPV